MDDPIIKVLVVELLDFAMTDGKYKEDYWGKIVRSGTNDVYTYTYFESDGTLSWGLGVDLVNRIEKFNELVKELGTSLEEQTQRVLESDTCVEDLEQDVINLNTQVEELERKLSNQEADNEKLREELEAIESGANYPDADDNVDVKTDDLDIIYTENINALVQLRKEFSMEEILRLRETKYI